MGILPMSITGVPPVQIQKNMAKMAMLLTGETPVLRRFVRAPWKGKQMQARPVLVVGIGNILLQDEGVGVHVARALQEEVLPLDVEVLDGGTSGADIIEAVADREKLIVIDAMQADAEAGAVFRMGMDELAGRDYAGFSLHELGLLETLQMAKLLGCLPREIVIFGVQPKSISPGFAMTDEVAAVLPRIVKRVVEECGKRGTTAKTT